MSSGRKEDGGGSEGRSGEVNNNPPDSSSEPTIGSTTPRFESPLATESGGRLDNQGGGSRAPLSALRDPSHYEELNVIGNGAYGTVYRARNKSDDTIVALKKMRFSLTEDGVPMAILREISLLKQLEKFEHPNIVRLLDICHGHRRDREMSLYLVFEHVHQDLASYLENCPSPGLGPDRIKDIFFQILNGIDFLHSHRIVHRDLKPQNLLITRDLTVKLTDFGLARIYEFYTLLTSVVVTLWYRSPEVLMGLSYATPVDMWSCGCIFAELFLRRPLFPGQNEMGQLAKIFEAIGTPSETEWSDASAVTLSNFANFNKRDWSELIPEIDDQGKDLLEKLLCFSTTSRLTAAEALLHPYFTDFGFEPITLSPSTSSSSRSMRTSEGTVSDRSLDSSSLSFSSHDDSFGNMSGTSDKQ